MEYVSTGSTGTGLVGIGIGYFTATEWCAILGVGLTVVGIGLAYFHNRKQTRIVQAAAQRQEDVLNRMLEVLERVTQKDNGDRGSDPRA